MTRSTLVLFLPECAHKSTPFRHRWYSCLHALHLCPVQPYTPSYMQKQSLEEFSVSVS